MASAPHRDAAARRAGGAGPRAAVAVAVPIALALVMHASPALAMGMGNKAPVIDSLTAAPLVVGKGGQVALVCVAHDDDGTVADYIWTATAGAFPGGAATETTAHPLNTIEWTAPTTPGLVTLTCTVKDDDAASSAPWSVDVTVADSWGPVIDSLSAAKTVLMPGEAAEIVCAATDPDGDPVTYVWAASGGAIAGDADADPERVTWTAPAAGGGYAVTVTVTDDKGVSTAGSVALVVRFAEHEASFADDVDTPLRVAVGSWGEYFATDKGRVIVLDPGGAFVREIAGLKRPTALAVSDDGEVFVGEAATGGIRAFDYGGAFLREVAAPGSFGFPSDMCLDGQGLLYVTDGKAHCVRVYSVDGGEVFSFGTPDDGDATHAGGEFSFPTGVAYLPATDHVIVCDQMNRRLQIFDSSGTYLSSIDENSGSVPINFSFAQGLDVDVLGRIFVTDSFQGCLGTVDEAGEWLGAVGSFGTAPGELKLPNDVAFDPTGKLVVSSTSNGRIEVFKLLDVTGVYTAAPGTKGEGGPGQETSPFGGGCGGAADRRGGSGALAFALAAAVLLVSMRRKAGHAS